MSEIYNLTQIKAVLENIDSLSAVEKGFIAYSKGRVVVPPVGEMLFELGNVIQDEKLQRSSDEQTTVADLTEVAVQDIQISKAVYEALALKKDQ